LRYAPSCRTSHTDIVTRSGNISYIFNSYLRSYDKGYTHFFSRIHPKSAHAPAMNKEQLKKFEADLWRAADSLRANSDLKATGYATILAKR